MNDINEKQKKILKLFNDGYGMCKSNGILYVYGPEKSKIEVSFEKDIKPLHEKGLIKSHNTMLNWVYLNLSEKGKLFINEM